MYEGNETQHLTGRFYHKDTFWGLILMVEYIIIGIDLPDNPHKYWRKANQKDLIELQLNGR